MITMLKIHFLDVGKGNCTICEFHSGRLGMVDIDNSRIHNDERVLVDPIEYFLGKFEGKGLFRFILTHPDMDHMSGLYELANKVSIANFWDTKHGKTFKEEDWEGSPYDRRDWEQYLKFRESSDDPKSLKIYRGDTSECCWTQDNIDILSPSQDLVTLSANTPDDDSEKYHHLSYVLMIKHAGIKILLGGDASVDAWESILETTDSDALKSDVFLAPHHGSKNNVNGDAFKAIDPDYVIVSVAKGVEYDYEYYSRLANERVLTTKHNGTIRMEIEDNGEFKLFVDRNP
jgi:competence protein ComEC